MYLIDAIHHQVQSIADATPDFGWAAPSPNKNAKVPFEGKIQQLMGWVYWIATAACVVGVIITGAKMAISWRGGNDANVAQLGWVLFGCILVGGAVNIVNAML
ncbi:hypothetical protein Drose_24895 [Dactylosporangium roseum]|uniref:Integral membrane protein n=1 Tax=Dactylosporangium roseum TaxID=47989 RepID=A0ABY5Z1S1_9ACTN|nr:TrbC/VirB2 family protein [Dactylosporangium roseum]UWZ34454.1 hypothetical protein Drose_24895 [Dactylosporangium roseum]